ncbi:MAG TPA: hypothetical protein VGJ00_00150 [Rhabdochlamydiaceae bacterium]|jgi:hypothetical protein
MAAVVTNTTRPVLSSGLAAGNSVMTDIRWLGCTLIEQAPSSPLGNVACVGYSAASIPNALIGPLNLQSDAAGFAYNQSIQNTAGSVGNVFNAAVSASQTSLGFARAMAIGTGIPNQFVSNSALAAVAAGSATAVSWIFLPYMGSIGVAGTYQALLARQFYKEYEKNGKTLSFLEEYISPPRIVDANAPDKNSAAAQLLLNDSARSDFHIIGYAKLKEAMQSKQKGSEEGLYYTNALTLDKILAEYFSAEPELRVLQENYFPQWQTLGLTPMGQLGLLLNARNIQQLREATVAQALGQDCLTQIKDTSVKNPTPEFLATAKEVIDTRYKETQTQYAMNGALGTISFILEIVGIAITVSFSLGPALLLAINLGLITTWICIDKKGADGIIGPRGRLDTLLIAVMVALMCASLAATIAGYILLNGNPEVFALSLALGAVMIGFYIKLYYTGKKKEEEWLAEQRRRQLNPSTASSTSPVENQTRLVIRNKE